MRFRNGTQLRGVVVRSGGLGHPSHAAASWDTQVKTETPSPPHQARDHAELGRMPFHPVAVFPPSSFSNLPHDRSCQRPISGLKPALKPAVEQMGKALKATKNALKVTRKLDAKVLALPSNWVYSLKI